MGAADSLMMLGVVAVGGYMAIKMMPQLMQGLTPQVVQAAPVAAPVAPACGVTKCDDKGDDVSCQCTGQAAFAMGGSRSCSDCTEVCKQRCAGQGNFVPDSDDDDDDDDDDKDSGGKQAGGVPGVSKRGLCQNQKGSWQGNCCSCPNLVCKNKCTASYARRSYASLLRDQTMNRIRRARMAQQYNNLYGSYNVRVV